MSLNRVITERNLTFDISTIESCISELSDEKITCREDYLFGRVCDRIDLINSEYVSKLDRRFDEITVFLQREDTSLEEASKVIKEIGKVSTDLFRTEISLYKSLLKGEKRNGRQRKKD